MSEQQRDRRVSVAVRAFFRSSLVASVLWFLGYLPLIYDSVDGFGVAQTRVWNMAVFAAVPLGAGIASRHGAALFAVPVGFAVSAGVFSRIVDDGNYLDPLFSMSGLALLMALGLAAALIGRCFPPARAPR
jgi:hypothetical protein